MRSASVEAHERGSLRRSTSESLYQRADKGNQDAGLGRFAESGKKLSEIYTKRIMN